MSAMEEIQDLVDRLAAEVQQSVAIDDPEGALLAVSRHYGDADGYRVKLLLERRILPEYRTFFEPHLVDVREVPIVIPADEELQIVGRIGYPITSQGRHVAFLWFIDRGNEIPHELVLEYCARLGELFTQWLGEELARGLGSNGESIRRLLLGEDLPELSRYRLADRQTQFVVLSAWADGLPPGERDVLRRRLATLPQRAGDLGFQLSHATSMHGLETAVYGRVLAADGREGVLVEEFADRADAHLRGIGVAGVSGAGLVARVRQLYTQAAVAGFLSRYLFRRRAVLRWNQISAAAASLAVPLRAGETAEIEALKGLLLAEDSVVFDTVGALLDCNGDRTRTAERLCVHRTTLHYRLQQLQTQCGLDLSEPADLHLATDCWLRVAIRRSPVGELLDDAVGEQPRP